MGEGYFSIFPRNQISKQRYAYNGFDQRHPFKMAATLSMMTNNIMVSRPVGTLRG
jgi:hypothetical protein